MTTYQQWHEHRDEVETTRNYLHLHAFPRPRIAIGDKFLVGGVSETLVAKRLDGFSMVAVFASGREMPSAELGWRVLNGEIEHIKCDGDLRDFVVCLVET
ncbi:MAG: hypothetical protein EBR82_32970 [Caulobacteraceae bacterium]|nr:hypothetical protein [Caulobacteraceae bacterium]